MGIRRQFIGFTGAVQVLLSLVMFAMSSTLSDIAIVQGAVQGSADDSSVDSMAIGVPLWGGIVVSTTFLLLIVPSTILEFPGVQMK